MRLSKDQSRQRWKEIRDLWNGWNPIGVSPSTGGPQDEYDSYLGQTLRLLEDCASTEEITGYLSSIVGEHMGLGQKGIEYSKPAAFSLKLQQWFAHGWKGSYV